MSEVGHQKSKVEINKAESRNRHTNLRLEGCGQWAVGSGQWSDIRTNQKRESNKNNTEIE
jgi:hypothetical protein